MDSSAQHIQTTAVYNYGIVDASGKSQEPRYEEGLENALQNPIRLVNLAAHGSRAKEFSRSELVQFVGNVLMGLNESLEGAWRTLGRFAHDLARLDARDHALSERIKARILIDQLLGWSTTRYIDQMARTGQPRIFELRVPSAVMQQLTELAEIGAHLRMTWIELQAAQGAQPDPPSHAISNAKAALAQAAPAGKGSPGWVSNRHAATAEGTTTRTLSTYRSQGHAWNGGLTGVDTGGRIWSKATSTTHPLYLKSSLRSSGKSTRTGRKTVKTVN